MKIRKKHIVITALCLFLIFSGCRAEPPAAEMPAPDNSAPAASAVDAAFPKIQTEQADTPPENAVQEEANQTAVETTDAYPSTEEIMSRVNAGESKLYWCAETPAYSGIMEIPPVEIPDTEDFTEQLSEMLGRTYRTADSSEHIIRLVPDGTEVDEESLLSTLSRLTGTEYAKIEPEEIYTTQYVPEFNGYPVDDEGFSYGGNRAGDIVPGSYVGVSENGEISIFNPLIVNAAARTVDTKELVTPETVETICRAYYENQIGPFVIIIKDIALEYYYSDLEESLLPAWRCEMNFYVTENGHDDSVLLDAQTGELLRE